jgi:hypothetical protein
MLDGLSKSKVLRELEKKSPLRSSMGKRNVSVVLLKVESWAEASLHEIAETANTRR